jgi:ACT domain-containing protein
MKKSDPKKELLLEQLRKAPIVEAACQKVGISRMTFYRWKQDDAEFAKNVDEAMLGGQLLVNDLAEGQLISAVRERNLQAITYWLRHHHPDYTDTIQIKHSLQDETLTPEQETLVREALRLASLSQSEIITHSQQNNEQPVAERFVEAQGADSAGTGRSDDQRQEGSRGDH